MSTANTKDTIYIEPDDEITLVIDKVLSSKERVVALVLPKRASVFQSTVNMKLLQKNAKSTGKKLVIVSSDATIKNMAALARVHIAQTLNSKPTIPKLTPTSSSTTVLVADEEPTEEHEESGTTHAETEPDEPDRIDVDTDGTESEADDVVADTDAAGTKKAKKSLKIPDFNRFQLRFGIGLAVVAGLFVGWLLGFVILPRATVTITTNVDRIDVSRVFTVDANSQATSVEDSVLKAVSVSTENVQSATVKATGEKDIGEKATGTVSLTNCVSGSGGETVRAGSVFAAEGRNFVTLSDVSIGPAVFFGTDCRSNEFGGVANVAVQAEEAGAEYNVGEQSMVSVLDGIFAFGSQMSGGTSEVITVVTEQDIESALSQLTGSSESAARTELSEALVGQSALALTDTLESSTPKDTQSSDAGSEVAEVTVTRTVQFEMLGIQQEELSQILDVAVDDALDGGQLNVRSNGQDNAVLRSTETISAGSEYTIRVSAVATIGPDFDEQAVKEQVAGMRRGEIEEVLESREGVRGVVVEYRPFWVFSTPSSADKIELVIVEEL